MGPLLLVLLLLCTALSYGSLLLDIQSINYIQKFIYNPFNQLIFGTDDRLKMSLLKQLQDLVKSKRSKDVDKGMFFNLLALLKTLDGMFENERKTPEYLIPRLDPTALDELAAKISMKIELENELTEVAINDLKDRLSFIELNRNFLSPSLNDVYQLIEYRDLDKKMKFHSEKVTIVHVGPADSKASKLVSGQLECWGNGMKVLNVDSKSLAILKSTLSIEWNEENCDRFLKRWWRVESENSETIRAQLRRTFFRDHHIDVEKNIIVPKGHVVQIHPHQEAKGLFRKTEPEFSLTTLYYILRSCTDSVVVMSLGNDFTDISSVPFYGFRKALATIPGLKERIIFVIPLTIDGLFVQRLSNQPGIHDIRKRCIAAPSANGSPESAIAFVTSSAATLRGMFPSASLSDITRAIFEGASPFTMENLQITVGHDKSRYFDMSFKYGVGRLNISRSVEKLEDQMQQRRQGTSSTRKISFASNWQSQNKLNRS